MVVLGGNSNADAVVVHAVNSTMGDKTATVEISGTESADGSSFAMSGSGAVDFSQSAAQLGLSLKVAGQQIQAEVIYVGGVIYESVPGIAQVEQGKSWVSINSGSTDAFQGSTTGALNAGGNPMAMLHLLAEKGNNVSSLGPSSVDGARVQGYSVDITGAQIQNDLQDSNFPSWARQAISNFNFGNGIQFTVFIDGHGLLRRETVSMDMSIDSNTFQVRETADFSGYGTAVAVTAPPSTDVVSLQQFLQDAQASEN
ncbi:MAG TPA: hypothetical protein VEJ87_05150 [Acidimicrobiales bacterium]|nr:hypothetical protein [Acidimicrobiales bacterium]